MRVLTCNSLRGRAWQLQRCSSDRAELVSGCERANLEQMPRRHGGRSLQVPCILRALTRHPESLRMSEDSLRQHWHSYPLQ